MPYDEELAGRVRMLVPSDADTRERRMFGGLAFLVGGRMAVAISGEGGLMVRCEPARTEALLAESGAGPMVMRGKELAGWLRVDVEALESDEDLRRWVGIGVAYAGAL